MNPPPLLSSPNGGLPSSVLWAQLILKDRLRPGDIQCVAPCGHVFAFDVQEAALIETRKRVPGEMTTLIHAGHETMRAHLPAELHGKTSAVMFNLGYLPGTDKTLITRTETTMIAVREALELLKPAGVLTVVVYPGHEGGADEGRSMAEWAATLDSRLFEVQHLRPVNRAASPPELWVVWKRG